jgi:hypothetical protein
VFRRRFSLLGLIYVLVGIYIAFAHDYIASASSSSSSPPSWPSSSGPSSSSGSTSTSADLCDRPGRSL